MLEMAKAVSLDSAVTRDPHGCRILRIPLELPQLRKIPRLPQSQLKSRANPAAIPFAGPAKYDQQYLPPPRSWLVQCVDTVQFRDLHICATSQPLRLWCAAHNLDKIHVLHAKLLMQPPMWPIRHQLRLIGNQHRADLPN